MLLGQVVQGSGRLLFIERVGVDCLPHNKQIEFQCPLSFSGQAEGLV
jgi:hypothetical protein